MDVKMDDLKLSMHELHKFTLTPTSLTVYFISKDRLIGWLFFSFRDRIISFFENVQIQSFEPFIKNLLDRSQRIFGPSTFSLLDRLLSSFCIVQFRFSYHPYFVFWNIELITGRSTISFFDRSKHGRFDPRGLSNLAQDHPLLTWSSRCILKLLFQPR